MVQKILFEIPIYSMSEAEFKKRLDKRNKKIKEKFGEQVMKRLLASNYPENVWKYNQIVGYVVVSVSKEDVNFEIHKSLCKKFFAESKTKKFIQNIQANGLHFSVDNKNDVEIHEEIRDELKFIEKNYIRKGMFIDYATFFNVFDAVNIRRIIDGL